MIEYTNEDCMTGMARYPDKYFDLAIVDPPYGIGVDKMTMFDGAKKQKRHKEYLDIKPGKEYFEELFRVSKNQIIWGGNYFELPPARCYLSWDKIQEFSGADFELAWTNFDKPCKAFRLCRAQAYGYGTIHPTQKPIALYKWLLKNYAKPNDKILDTHVGSASSLVACYDMGFDAVGFELDPDYYAASKRRLEDFMRQPKLTELMTEELEQMDLQMTEGGTADAD